MLLSQDTAIIFVSTQGVIWVGENCPKHPVECPRVGGETILARRGLGTCGGRGVHLTSCAARYCSVEWYVPSLLEGSGRMPDELKKILAIH